MKYAATYIEVEITLLGGIEAIKEAILNGEITNNHMPAFEFMIG